MKRKDNLTDLVEHIALAGKEEGQQDVPIRQEVVNAEGEVITLGHENTGTEPPTMQGNPLELSKGRLEQAVQDRLTAGIDNFLENEGKRENGQK